MPRGGIFACVAVAATAVLATTAPAAVAGTVPATTADQEQCVSLGDLTSVQTSFVTQGGPGIGESATFTDNILDSSGQTIGTRQGWVYIAYADPSTGDLMALYDAVFTLPSGLVDSSGVIDTADALAGKVTTIAGFGLTGAYAGMTGTVSNLKVTATTDTVNIDLCHLGLTPLREGA